MTIESLLEESIITDLRKDPAFENFPIRAHDYAGAKSGDDAPGSEEVRAVLTVTCKKLGELKIGSGIRKVRAEVEIRANGAVDNFSGTQLDQLSEVVEDRLQPSANVGLVDGKQVTGRETAFATDKLKIYGILDDETARSNQALERVRTVARVFIAAQLAS